MFAIFFFYFRVAAGKLKFGNVDSRGCRALTSSRNRKF